MTTTHGRYTWYELMTTDTKAAKVFYGKVLGWGTQEMPNPAMPYTLFTLAERPVAGLMTLPEQARAMGAPPSWVGYVGVDDVDATTQEITRLGGKIYMKPTDIPEVGRFAVVADPQGATFALLTRTDPAQGQAAPGTPGRAGWHELMAVDWEQAFAFYSKLFGWQKGEPVNMGEMGTYQLFTIGGEAIGGMFNKPPMLPVPFWLYYFNVADIEAAGRRITAAGGRVMMGPHQVPTGSWIIHAQDPQGAMFALVGPKG